MISRRMLRIKVVKALYAHMKSDADSLMASEKMLVTSIDKTYDLYFLLMSLVVEMAQYAEQRQEAAKNKKLPTYEDLNPNRKFVDNAVIRLLAQSDSVNDYLASRKLSWAKYPELVKALYTQLEQSDYFKKYMTSQESSFREDLALITEFYTRELEESEILESALDEMSILWNDDLGFALTLVIRTLSNMRASHTEVKYLPKFKDYYTSEEELSFLKSKAIEGSTAVVGIKPPYDIYVWNTKTESWVNSYKETNVIDDLDFARELFAKAAVNFDNYQEEIEKYTRNWDVERIAFMDNLIMATAVAELVTFPSIPVKVTLDEYIEIAKYYSTHGSSTFINGILDKIVASFTEEGKINKSGRGLI